MYADKRLDMQGESFRIAFHFAQPQGVLIIWNIPTLIALAVLFTDCIFLDESFISH